MPYILIVVSRHVRLAPNRPPGTIPGISGANCLPHSLQYLRIMVYWMPVSFPSIISSDYPDGHLGGLLREGVAVRTGLHVD